MPEVVSQMRRVGLVVAGVGSILLGLLVAWAFVRPGVIGGVGTGALAAIFGLLALPGIVYWIWTIDRRAAVRHAARRRSLEALAGAQPEPLRAEAATAPSASRPAVREVGAPVAVIHEPIRTSDGRRERSHRATPRSVHVG